MPELSPKQVAIWLALAALVLVIGGKALRGGGSTTLDVSEFADKGAGEKAAPAERRGGRRRGALWVHVAGAVRRPGIYRLPDGSRVADALRRAGGGRPAADLDRINLAAAVTDGQQVLVPRRGEMALAGGAGTAGAPISLATATTEQLETIDGVGPVTAGKILEFRDSRGGVGSVEELDAIPGIGPATMETLRQALVP